MRLPFFHAVLATLFTATVCTAAAPVTVAVLYFDNNSLVDKTAYDGLSKGLCDMLITELSHMQGLRVVEREKLDRVMAEIALGQSGAVDEATAARVGNLLGAQVLVTGGYMKASGSQIRIDMRMVRVETGEVLKAEEVTGSAAKLFQLITRLTFKIAENLDVTVTGDEKKKVAAESKAGLDALLRYSEGLTALDRGDSAAARLEFEAALDADKSFTRARAMIGRIGGGR